VAAVIAYTHHERFDGTGYPRGLKGEAIPIEGRIASIADAFDALTTQRVCQHFDPDLLDVFIASQDEIARIHSQYGDRSLRSML
jgi:putative two-component system response regulator